LHKSETVSCPRNLSLDNCSLLATSSLEAFKQNIFFDFHCSNGHFLVAHTCGTVPRPLPPIKAPGKVMV